MTITRRGFMQSMLALGAAPVIVRAESLMRMRPTHLTAYPANMIACDEFLTERKEWSGGASKFTVSYTYEATGIQVAIGAARATRVFGNGREIPSDTYDVSPSGILTFKKPLDLAPYGNAIPDFAVA